MMTALFTLFGLILLSLLGFYLKKRLEQNQVESSREELSLDKLLLIVKNEIMNNLRFSLKKQGLSDEAFKRQLRNRSSFIEALKRCIWGSDNDKLFVKDVIYDILKNLNLTRENINYLINFDNEARLGSIDKFDILLYSYKKDCGKNALKELIKKYGLDEGKAGEDGAIHYEISEEDIEAVYDKEMIYLSEEDRLRMIAQRIYQRYKGFSVIDEIRDMNIDGVSAGVSGISTVDIMNDYDLEDSFIKMPRNYESTWIFFEGKSIHLSFLSFGSEAELKRVCQNIYRYNSSGMLSQDVGYKVGEMMDGSRIVVVRPDFSESWAFFVRKFQLKKINLEELIKDENCDIPIKLIKFLAKGARISAITGSQGSGKTTLLMAMVGEIYSQLTIRVQEMSSELHLRRLYPMRNILSFKETNSITGQEGLDLQKKTDGSVNILGEVASDEVAAWMIQMAQVASLFTIFTHHAKKSEDLILSLRNSLLKEDVFRNEKVAEEQVVDVLDFDIHLKKDYNGRRYIERITEIIPVDRRLKLDRAYKNKEAGEMLEGFMDAVCDYFDYISTGKCFTTRDIIRFQNGAYHFVNPISERQVEEMKEVMDEEDRRDFSNYLENLVKEVGVCSL